MIWVLRFSRYADFLSRKFKLYVKKLLSIGMEVDISPSAKIALTSEISAVSGSLRIGSHCLVDRGVVIRTYGGRIEIGALSTIGP